MQLENEVEITPEGYHGKPTPAAENLYKAHKTHAERYEALKAMYPALLAEAIRHDRSGVVRNENSFAAGITTNFLITACITKLGPMLAPLRAFCRSADVDPYKPLASGVFKFNTTVQDGSDTLTNPTDFTASSDSVIGGDVVTVNQYTQAFHLTNAQLNSGIRMADLLEAKLGSFKTKLASVLTAPITAANFGAQQPLIISAPAFTLSDLATVQGQLKRSPIKNIIMDGPYIARIANVPGFFQTAGTLGGPENGWKAFGWDLICQLTEWAGADPYVVGFACNPQAIGVVAGLPLNPLEGIPGGVVQVGTAVLPGLDVAIATYLWMDANARTMRGTFDLMLGAIAVDTTAGVIIKTQ